MEFDLARASTGVSATLIGIAALLGAMAAIFAWYAWSASHARVSLRDGALDIEVPFYGRSIPLANLELTQATVVDLDTSSRLRPRTRTNGIGLPGYGVGWFRLVDGSRALLVVSRRSNVLYLPTSEGYSVLLSLKDPQALLAALRSTATRP